MRCSLPARRLSLVLTPLALALSSTSPLAQNAPSLGLEEIIVTAQRRAENVLEVPISMSVETADSLQKKGIATLQALSVQTPSLITQDGGRVSYVSIRGLGTGGLDTMESSVGIYIDEIYFGRSRLSRNPLFDMDRVEVLRGPQGTLYGRNTIAGAISMHTARPTQEFSARVLGETGNLDSHKLEGSISGPITDNFAVRVAALNSRRGAYLKNELGPDGGGQQTEGYRLSASWNPIETLSVFGKYETMVHENVGTYDQITADPFGVFAGYPGIDVKVNRRQQVSGTGLQSLKHPGGYFTSEAAALHLNWELGGGYALKSVSGWTTYDARSRDWITASPDSALTINGMTERVDYWSQELRIESPDDRRFRFLGGVFADRYEVETLPRAGDFASINLAGSVLPGFVRNLVAGGMPQFIAQGFAAGTGEAFRLITPSGDPVTGISNLEQDIKTWSVFLEAQYDFTEQWRLTAGARYARETDDTKMAKGTFYRDGLGRPWGRLPSGADIAATAIAADPTLAYVPGLAAIYDSVLSNPLNPAYPPPWGPTVADLPSMIAAPTGTPPIKDRIKENRWMPSLKLQYFPHDDAMYYLTVATGFKAGGFNSSNINAYTRAGDTFGGEKSIALEIGTKQTLLDGRAVITAALFRTNFKDMQASTITPQGAAQTVNAARAVVQGFEIDGVLRISESLTAGASWAWLDAYYTDSKELGCGGYMKALRQSRGEDFSTTPCTFRLDKLPNGKDVLQRSPRNTAGIWGEFRQGISNDWEMQLYASLSYRGKNSTTLDDYLWAGSITNLNARMAFADLRNGWTIAVFGDNLLDDDALVLQQENSGGAVKGIITTPRTYGLQLAKSW